MDSSNYQRYFLMRAWPTLYLSMLLGIAGCSPDPMEACMKQGLERKLSAEGGDRGAYIKAREQVRSECEKKLK